MPRALNRYDGFNDRPHWSHNLFPPIIWKREVFTPYNTFVHFARLEPIESVLTQRPEEQQRQSGRLVLGISPAASCRSGNGFRVRWRQIAAEVRAREQIDKANAPNEDTHMKVCIQDTATKEYYKSPYVWVEDRFSARDFVTTLEARDLCHRMDGGRRAQVLLLGDIPQHDVCLFRTDEARVVA